MAALNWPWQPPLPAVADTGPEQVRSPRGNGVLARALEAAALHPRLSSTCAGRIISAATVDSHRTTCESVRMRESNRSVCPVEMAVGVWVVMRPSGQGGFQVQKVAPWMCRGPAAQSQCMHKLAQRQPPGHDGAVWNHHVGSNPSKNDRERARGQRRDCSSSTESSHHRCCWSAAESTVHVEARWGGVPVWDPI